MSAIIIRKAVATDIKTLMAFDHSVKTDYVWQFDLSQEEGQQTAIFREIRLPRSVVVQYPKSLLSMVDDWNRQSLMLVALFEETLCGYIRINENLSPEISWITDLVVSPSYRQQGIASKLIFSSIKWSIESGKSRINIEAISKNHPAINLYSKLRFEFCGYNDHYYESNDIALFFYRELR